MRKGPQDRRSDEEISLPSALGREKYGTVLLRKKNPTLSGLSMETGDEEHNEGQSRFHGSGSVV